MLYTYKNIMQHKIRANSPEFNNTKNRKIAVNG